MINKVNILNIITNNSLELDRAGNMFVLDEIDWDSPSVSMETYRVPYQVGKTLAGVMVGTRKPTITGYIIADMSKQSPLGMTWTEYYDLQEQMIEESKLVLDKVISIYQDVQIEANGYYLDARPTQPPKYSNKEKENNKVLCYFELEFECYNNPLFYQSSKTVNLATIIGKFHFPLVIPRTEKLIFGEIMRRQSMSIENNGDANAGCVIKISANGGSVKDPKVYNVNTGDYIGFENVTLQDGDYITITTDIGEENAIKHIAETAENFSVVGSITQGSKFIQIQQGSSFYAYDVGEEYRNNIEVSVMFTEKYFNVRGM